MVMMQSPSLSDSGQQPESPVSNPDSPINNNNNSANTPNHEIKNQANRYDDIDHIKDIKPKFSVLCAINKENSSTIVSRNNNLDQILYPKLNERDLLEPSAKFSIERLKQLADQRLSPSNIENSGLTNNKIFTIDHSAKYQNNSNSIMPTANGLPPGLPLNVEINNHSTTFTNQLHPPTHLNILSHNNHLNNLKYGLLPTVGLPNHNNNNNNNNNNNPNELEIERIKLARTLSNGKELSDFGFRIQLGGLTTNYAHSETHSDSEELNVDGNEDSSHDENSVSYLIKSRLIYCLPTPH